jgi:GNAT superfamily N-acetyltransferase
MAYIIRLALQHDAVALTELMRKYMRETYHGEWGGNADLLSQHLASRYLTILAAETELDEIVGFVAWISSYDLHWCMKGGDVIDFFVCPEHRGRGAAILLIAALAKHIEADGGTYLKGGAVDDAKIRKLYQKVAMSLPDGESYISGRAFRHLAELSGQTEREIVKRLPDPAWNLQP